MSSRNILNKKNIWPLVMKICSALNTLFVLILMLLLFKLNLLTNPIVLIFTLVFLLWAVFLLILTYKKSKAFKTLGGVLAILSLLVSIVLVWVSATFLNTLGNLTDSNITTSNMVVAVRVDDPANVLSETQGYTYGTQTAVSQNEQSEMMDHISQSLLGDLTVQSFPSLNDEANALLNGQVQAAVYNEAFTDLLNESIPDYSDKVKIIHSYGINSVNEGSQKNKDSFLFYISGIDTDGAITNNSRSDVNLLLAVNEKTHKITMVTTPRDYFVEIPGISGGARDKLTHAGIYGIDASMAALDNLYGTDIDYYARVNFSTLVSVVDALGGVDVYVDEPFSTRSGEYFGAGMNHLNGEQALAFSRERYHLAGGDNDRGKNQQKVLSAIIQKAASPAIITGAGSIVSNLSYLFQTNMPQSKLTQLISDQIRSGKEWQIETYAAAGTGGSDVPYSMPWSTAYVMYPDIATVNVAANALKATLSGN